MDIRRGSERREDAEGGEKIPSAPGGVEKSRIALINAGLAQGKNRSGLNWFLLSLLLGPIATFILVAFFERLPPR